MSLQSLVCDLEPSQVNGGPSAVLRLPGPQESKKSKSRSSSHDTRFKNHLTSIKHFAAVVHGISTDFAPPPSPQGLLKECNGFGADYLFQPDKVYDVSYDTGDKSIQCGRHVDAFKLWLMWKAKVKKKNVPACPVEPAQRRHCGTNLLSGHGQQKCSGLAASGRRWS